MDNHSATTTPTRTVTVKTVGAYEVKTHLAAILDQVERGSEFIITRHGKEVARVVPSIQNIDRDAKLAEALKKSTEARARSFLNGISWKELRDDGRRFLD